MWGRCPVRPPCERRKPMPPGDINESRLRAVASLEAEVVGDTMWPRAERRGLVQAAVVRSPVAYHSAGSRWGTATLKLYKDRDILPALSCGHTSASTRVMRPGRRLRRRTRTAGRAALGLRQWRGGARCGASQMGPVRASGWLPLSPAVV